MLPRRVVGEKERMLGKRTVYPTRIQASTTASSPLKKGTGSEPRSENLRENNGREVPVPLFQRAARGSWRTGRVRSARIGTCPICGFDGTRN